MRSAYVVCALGLVFSACGYVNPKDPGGASLPGASSSSPSGGGTTAGGAGSGSGAGTGTGGATATFQAVSSQILQPKCVACHSQFSSYSGVMGSVVAGNPGSSRLYTRVQSGSMPQGGPPLSQSELSLISDWIQQGAQNN